VASVVDNMVTGILTRPKCPCYSQILKLLS